MLKDSPCGICSSQCEPTTPLAWLVSQRVESSLPVVPAFLLGGLLILQASQRPDRVHLGDGDVLADTVEGARSSVPLVPLRPASLHLLEARVSVASG